MLDKQFTLISGSICIVVLLMLLARTDAAPQVGEIDVMQETVTSLGAPSDSPIYSVYRVDLDSMHFDCEYTIRNCRLEVGRSKECLIKLVKGNLPACGEGKKATVTFEQVSPNRLKMTTGLGIEDSIDIEPYKDLNGHKRGVATFRLLYSTASVYMQLERK
eukprot:Nk52_evm60s151 gene=Nk52_evmTU60s151